MRRFVRAVALLALVGVLLVAAMYVVQGLSGAARVAANRERARAELTEALPQGQRRADAQRERVRATLRGLGAATYSWQDLVCELDTNDVGWIVEEYVQDCIVRSVDLIPVSRVAQGDCEYLYFPDAIEASGNGAVGVRRGSFHVLAADRPWRRSCPDGLTGPPFLGASRMLDGRRPSDLSSSPGWVVVELRTPVSRTVLGCDPWAVILCHEPVDAPLLPRTMRSVR